MKVKIKYFAIALMFASLLSCAHSTKKRVNLDTFEKNDRWGYEITINDKLYIYQDCIPAIAGNKKFANKKEAELVGRLVLKKILNKETPTVNTGELRQLGIKGTS